MLLYDQFAQDAQGRKFADVLGDARINFRTVCDFFDDPDRQRRMIESEVHHDRPALAGVIKELEAQSDVAAFFQNHDGHTTTRFRQAVGLVVKLAMQNRGFRTTGNKGSLGTRTNVAARTTTPGAYHNTSGLSLWFTRAERYSDPAVAAANGLQTASPSPKTASNSSKTDE